MATEVQQQQPLEKKKHKLVLRISPPRRKEEEEEEEAATPATVQPKEQPLFDWKQNSFQKYVRHLFPTEESFFGAWPVQKVMSESYVWQSEKSPLYMYVTAYDCAKYENRSYIGGSRDLFTRICQLNGMPGLPGAPADAKKFQGFCRIVCYLVLPPVRNYSITEFMSVCKVKRGWMSRCQQLLDLAERHSLDFKVTKECFNRDSRLYSEEIASHVTRIAKHRVAYQLEVATEARSSNAVPATEASEAAAETVRANNNRIRLPPDIRIPLEAEPFIIELAS